MFKKIWIHLQAYTIVALVYSPAFLMMLINQISVPTVDLGTFSDATEYDTVTTFHISLEESLVEEIAKENDKATDEGTNHIKQEQTKPKAVSVKKQVESKPQVLSSQSKKTKELTKETNAPIAGIQKTTESIQKPTISSAPRKNNIKRDRTQIRKRHRSKCFIPPNRRIQSIQKGEYAVQKDLVQTYLDNLSNFQKLAKAYWYKGKKGEGILLQQIPCKSPLRHLGLKPKDIILAVNEKPITNNVDVLSSYIKLKSKKNIDILLKRGDRQLRLKYRIVKNIQKG